MTETRWIPDFEGLYKLDRSGQMFNKHGRPLKLRNYDRSKRYRLHKNGMQHDLSVSKLLQWTFK